MARPTKAEEAEIVGKVQINAIKEAAKEAVQANKEDDPLKELQDLIDQAMHTPAQAVIIQVSRKASLGRLGGYKYIGTIDYIDAQTLATFGIMYVIRDFSGGGDYECVVKVQGLKDKMVRFAIEGEPLVPKPERQAQPQLLQQLPHQQQSYFQQQSYPGFQGSPQLPVGATMPWSPQQLNPLNPLHQQIMQGNPGLYQQPQPIDKMLTLFEKMMQEQREVMMNSGEDPERRRLEQELQEARRRAERLEEKRETERKLEEMERRHQELLANLRGQQQPQPNTSIEITKALAPVVGSILPMLLSRGDEQVKNLNEVFRGVLEGQKAASETQARTYETLLNRPGAEDRIIKVSEAVAKSLASNVGLVGTLLNGVLADRVGNDPPPWLQIVSQLIDTGGHVAQSMLGGSFDESEEDEEASWQLQPPPHMMQRIPAQARVLRPDGVEAAQAARARILGRGMPTPGGLAEAETPVEQAPAPRTPQIQIEQFDTAMQTIFTMIVQGGDAREVAFRLWKHAASGVKIASDWFGAPEQGTQLILGSLRAAEQLTVTDERIVEISAAIREFNEYLGNGGSPEDYLNEHKIGVKMPKSVRIPVGRMSSQAPPTDGPEFGQHVVTPAPVGEIKIIDQEPPAVVPTPGLDSKGPSRESTPSEPTQPILRRPQIARKEAEEREERRDPGEEETTDDQQPAATP